METIRNKKRHASDCALLCLGRAKEEEACRMYSSRGSVVIWPALTFLTPTRSSRTIVLPLQTDCSVEEERTSVTNTRHAAGRSSGNRRVEVGALVQQKERKI